MFSLLIIYMFHCFFFPCQPERIAEVAPRWMPAGRRKRGRPKTTWRRTAEIELSEMGLTWGEDQEIVKNKTWWMRIIGKLKKPQR